MEGRWESHASQLQLQLQLLWPITGTGKLSDTEDTHEQDGHVTRFILGPPRGRTLTKDNTSSALGEVAAPHHLSSPLAHAPSLAHRFLSPPLTPQIHLAEVIEHHIAVGAALVRAVRGGQLNLFRAPRGLRARSLLLPSCRPALVVAHGAVWRRVVARLG